MVARCEGLARTLRRQTTRLRHGYTRPRLQHTAHDATKTATIGCDAARRMDAVDDSLLAGIAAPLDAGPLLSLACTCTRWWSFAWTSDGTRRLLLGRYGCPTQRDRDELLRRTQREERRRWVDGFESRLRDAVETDDNASLAVCLASEARANVPRSELLCRLGHATASCVRRGNADGLLAVIRAGYRDYRRMWRRLSEAREAQSPSAYARVCAPCGSTRRTICAVRTRTVDATQTTHQSTRYRPGPTRTCCARRCIDRGRTVAVPRKDDRPRHVT